MSDYLKSVLWLPVTLLVFVILLFRPMVFPTYED